MTAYTASAIHADRIVEVSNFARLHQFFTEDAAKHTPGICYYTTAARDRFFAFGYAAANTKYTTGMETCQVRVNGEYVEVCDIRNEPQMRNILYEMATAGWIVRIAEYDL